MSRVRLVEYDKDKPTVFVDLNETLITSLLWSDVQKATRLGVPTPRPGVKVQNYVHWLRPDAEQFLQELSGRGYQLFILTNGPKGYQKEVVEQLGLSKYVLQVLGRQNYDPRKLECTTKSIPRPTYFVLFDDADLDDDERRSILKLKGLGLKLPTHYEYWTDAHKALALKHLVLGDVWEIERLQDLEVDPPSLMQHIAQIDEKLQKQINQE